MRVVKKLTLNGFKSFAKKTELPLEFSSVAFVGPNGSGKSNVADALRWVLGEQALKSIRANKQEDLIFAGSTDKAPKGMAEVELLFDNSEQFFDLPYEEVAVGRRIHRDGQSEYLINGNRVLLREMLETLAKSRLGSLNLAVIGQGEIDTILTLGSQEIKALMEDASGIKPLQMMRHATMRNLKNSFINVQRLRDILNEIEPRLRDLKRESKQALEYGDLITEKKRLQTIWHRMFLGGVKKNLDELQAQLTKLREEQADLQTSIANLEKTIAEHEESVAKDQQEVRAQQERIEQLQHQRNDLWQEQANLKAKIEFNRSQVRTLGLAFEGEEHGSIQTEIAACAQAIEVVTRELATIASQQQEKQSQLDKIHAQHETARAALFDLETSIPPELDNKELRKRLAAVRDLYTELSGELFVRELGAEELQHLLASGKTLDASIKQELDTLVHDLGQHEELQAQVGAMRRQLQQLFTQMQQTQQDLLQVQRFQRDKQRELELWESKRLQYEHQLNAQSAHEKKSDAAYRRTLEKEAEILGKQLGEVEHRIEELDGQIADLKEQIEQYFARSQQHHEIDAAHSELIKQQHEADKLSAQYQSVMVDTTRYETRWEDGVQRAGELLGMSGVEISEMVQLEVTQESYISEDVGSLEERIANLSRRLEHMGEINQKAPQEYEELRQRHERLFAQVDDLEKTGVFIQHEIEQLDKHIKELFDHVFAQTDLYFGQYFQILFGGGEGKLSLYKDELTGEVDIAIRAQPPGKRAHDLAMLSGGERSLGAVALLFAILETCQTPFCVLDEVDAALDEANVGRFGEALQRLNHNTQVVLVTHNRRTMHQVNCLYGVSMRDDGTSQILSLKFAESAATNAA
jgi:chromosome segregation protein